MNPLELDAIKAVIRGLEDTLLRRLEEELGRVPSAEEVKQHAHVYVFPDGDRHYTWAGKVLFIARPFPIGSGRFGFDIIDKRHEKS